MRSGSSLAVVLTTVFLVGCGGDPTSASAPGFAGAYTLTSVNALTLPATLQPTAANTITVLSGTLSVRSDARYTISTAWDETASGVTTRHGATCAGTWTRNGNAFSFTEIPSLDCGGNYTATWDGGSRVTIVFSPSLQAVFER